MSNNIVLSIRNLVVSFKTLSGEFNALRGIDIDLPRGKTLAIVGESGSGKSLTSKACMRILPKNATVISGEIIFSSNGESVDLLKLTTKQIRKDINGKRIAMVFQDPMTSLNPTMTVGKQIVEGMRLHYGFSKKQAYDKTIALLNEVSITDPERRVKQYPHELSGGMRQRVVIAIALACDPEVLICDEPTTALDVRVQATIIDLLKRIQTERGLSVIFITHDLGVVESIADYVSVMYAGKVVERGLKEEIFLEPKHPYTWGLLRAMPNINTSKEERLYTIKGNPPNLEQPIVGDAFAIRNEYALNIDYKEEPPMFKVSETHYAATWLLDEKAPKVESFSLL